MRVIGLSAICGACVADLGKVWHADTCPALLEDWNARCGRLINAQNGTATLLVGIKACLLLPEAVSVTAELKALEVWAAGVESAASRGLRELFPFSAEERHE